MSAQEAVHRSPALDVHCVACGDRWDPFEGRRGCRCGRSRVAVEDGEILLQGPIEAAYYLPEEPPVVTTGLSGRWPDGAPAVRRRRVEPLV
jgi:hypothetical protein